MSNSNSLVGGVRLVLAHVARARPTPGAGGPLRPMATASGARDHADPARAFEPDPVVRQQRLVLRDLLVHDVAELEHLLVPARRDVVRHAADAHRVVRQARAAELLEQIEDELPLAQPVQEDRDRADVHRVAADPHEVAGDPLQLGEHRPDVARAPRHLERQQLLHRLAVPQVVRRRRDVVHAVGQQDDLRPVAVLAELLDARGAGSRSRRPHR